MKRIAAIGLYSALIVLSWCGVSAAEGGADSLEGRKREYESLQKDLEVARPAEDASKEELVAYLELAKDSYEKFAKAHPKTPEGFESAASIAELLNRFHHVDALKYSELAVESAPAAGVDLKRVAICWVWVVQGRLEKQDTDGALSALEKIKPLSKDLYDRVAGEVNTMVEKIKHDQDIASKLKPGNEPLPIKGKDTRGKEFNLDDWQGKVVIVHFWSPSFTTELQNLADLYKRSKSRGLEIVGISVDENANDLQDAIRDNDVTWPVLSDHKGWESAYARAWGIMSLPRNYVIDRKGLIRYVNVKDEALSAAVKKLLNEDK